MSPASIHGVAPPRHSGKRGQGVALGSLFRWVAPPHPPHRWPRLTDERRIDTFGGPAYIIP